MDLVTVENSKIHRNGVFAKQDIKKGTHIIEYFGEIITNKEADKRAERDNKNGTVYLFELDDKWTLDGDVPNNPAKYINHSCQPNCETEIEKNKIWIIATKDIKKGEEITYDYGFDHDVAVEHPCRCGTHNCRGYIVAEDEYTKMTKYLAEMKTK